MCLIAAFLLLSSATTMHLAGDVTLFIAHDKWEEWIVVYGVGAIMAAAGLCFLR
jgi:hypothetical protein